MVQNLTKREALERGRLNRLQYAVTGVSTLALAASGAALWGIRTFLPLDEEGFSLYRHASEPWWQVLHVMVAPVFLFGLGYIFLNHVKRHWKARLHRGSGALLLAAAVLMTWSGYLLYFVSGEALRPLAVKFHGLSGALFLAILATHVVAGRLAKTREGCRPFKDGPSA